MALERNGTVFVWGNNYYGQLGDNNNVNAYIPFELPDPEGKGDFKGVKAITGGEHHTVALKKNGTVWAWEETM